VIQETEEQLNGTKDQIPLSKWAYAYDKDIVGGTLFDTFALSPGTETIANMETCLTKCNEQDYCKGVVFNDTFDWCWGKSSVTDTTITNPNRILYTKTDAADGILEPWNRELPTPPTVDVETEIPVVKSTKWTFEDGVDVTGNQTFHYTLQTDPSANFENCIKECDNQPYCKAVVFNEDKSQCWGKRSAVRRRSTSDRSLYTKTDGGNGMSEPWNFCSIDENIFHPMCEPQLHAKCTANPTHPDCAVYNTTQAKKQLDKKCATNITDAECAGYDAYEKQKDLDELCATNTTDKECAGYNAYDLAEMQRLLDTYCTDETGTYPARTSDRCAGYPLYDAAQAEKENDIYCERNKRDERCAGYPAYEKQQALDKKCETNITDAECAGYLAYESKKWCRNYTNDFLDRWQKKIPSWCFIWSCLKKDAHSSCEENPDRDRIRSVAKEMDDEILEELCKDSKDSNGNFKSTAPSACRSTGNRCGSEANGGKCAGDQCCGYWKWCGGTTGGQWTDHCTYLDGEGGYRGRDGGIYDGTASRDEADKIARRPDDFLETVYHRVQDLNEKCETNTTDEECAGYEAYDDETKRQCEDDTTETARTSERCVGYSLYEDAEAKRQLDAYCKEETVDVKCAGYDAYDNKQRLDKKCETNTTDAECAGYDAYDRANTFWKFKPYIDITSGTDTFHYFKTSNPKASLEVCLKTCRDQGDCNGVVFDTDEELCWGKSGGSERVDGTRKFFAKTSDPTSVKEPWNFCSKDENILNQMCKAQLDAKCETNTTDEVCAGYAAYEKRQLDDYCKDETVDEKCAGYEAYEDKKKADLDEYCKEEDEDEKCAGYEAYEQKQLDDYCKEEDEDEKCAGYEAYENKQRLDDKCATNDTDAECAGYDAYDNKQRLDDKCATNITDAECAGYQAYEDEKKRRLGNTFWKFKPDTDIWGGTNTFHYKSEVCWWKRDYYSHSGYRYVCADSNPKASLEVCLKKCKDQGDDCTGVVFDTDEKLCWGKDGGWSWGNQKTRKFFEKTSDPTNIKEPWNFCSENINLSDPFCKPQLDEYCEDETVDEKCAGYAAYERVQNPDIYCQTNDTDEVCAGYAAYEQRQLDDYCREEDEDEKCAGYDAYEQRQLDDYCATNTTDERCAGYDAYEQRQLDDYCKDETVDEKCAGYPAYKRAQNLDTYCATNITTDPLCFIRSCLKKDAPSSCEENPDRDSIRSIAKEIDDEILTELCKDSKDSSGIYKSNTPSACRNTSEYWCGTGTWRGNKCSGDACCSFSGTCGGTTGGPYTTNCHSRIGPPGSGVYQGWYGGMYDGTASRDEADKIARRPDDFLDTVYQRVQEMKAS
jgi:hypothetical protein